VLVIIVLFLSTSCNLHALTQPEKISSQQVHIDCLGYIVGIMAGQDFISFYKLSASIKSLPPENATESAVICQTDYFDDLIHGPAVEVFIGDYSQGKLVSFFVLFDGLEGVVSVTCDSFIYGK